MNRQASAPGPRGGTQDQGSADTAALTRLQFLRSLRVVPEEGEEEEQQQAGRSGSEQHPHGGRAAAAAAAEAGSAAAGAEQRVGHRPRKYLRGEGESPGVARRKELEEQMDVEQFCAEHRCGIVV